MPEAEGMCPPPHVATGDGPGAGSRIWRRSIKVEAEEVGVHRGATAGAGFEARRRNLTNERPLDEGVHGAGARLHVG